LLLLYNLDTPFFADTPSLRARDPAAAAPTNLLARAGQVPVLRVTCRCWVSARDPAAAAPAQSSPALLLAHNREALPPHDLLARRS
jgi:hypothetical protein